MVANLLRLMKAANETGLSKTLKADYLFDSALREEAWVFKERVISISHAFQIIMNGHFFVLSNTVKSCDKPRFFCYCGYYLQFTVRSNDAGDLYWFLRHFSDFFSLLFKESEHHHSECLIRFSQKLFFCYY